ncbi:hypothetical protein HDE_00446 [Halotydeus destructor]|nr:hypothetical protein HDE_00446 [Halotydeus destructor]
MELFSEAETEPEMPVATVAKPRTRVGPRSVVGARRAVGPKSVSGPRRAVGPKSAVGPRKALQVEAVEEDQDDDWSLDPFEGDEIQPWLENDSEWVREIERGALEKLRDSMLRGNDRLKEMAVEVSVLLTRMRR